MSRINNSDDVQIYSRFVLHFDRNFHILLVEKVNFSGERRNFSGKGQFLGQFGRFFKSLFSKKVHL